MNLLFFRLEHGLIFWVMFNFLSIIFYLSFGYFAITLIIVLSFRLNENLSIWTTLTLLAFLKKKSYLKINFIQFEFLNFNKVAGSVDFAKFMNLLIFFTDIANLARSSTVWPKLLTKFFNHSFYNFRIKGL